MADLVIFGGAAAARNGLTALPVNGGEDFYKINQTNFLVSPANMQVLASLVQTAGVANILQSRLHRTDDADWMDFGTSNLRDQTGAYTADLPARHSYDFPLGKQLAAELNNTNNSQVDVLGAWISKNPNEKLSFGPLGVQPDLKGYAPFRFTGATTVTAGILSNVALTAVTFNPDDNAKYHIAGAKGNSATGLFGRLQHRQGGTQNIRPGFLVGDTAVPDVTQWTFQDFGTFTGDQYPIVQHQSVLADTSSEYTFLIKKVA